MKKIYFLTGVGNILEFYDFALYGFYANTLRDLFIPVDHPLTGLFLVYGIFTIGFLSRPFGGFLFGFLGDKYGRKKALSLSLVGTGLATLGIALLPNHQTIGIFAPIFLTLFRIVQGTCLGGEWTNSLVFISEYLEKYRVKSPSMVTGVVSSMGVLGYFLASLLTNFFNDQEGILFSWRIPFLLGSVVAAFGIYFRKNTDDPFFEQAHVLNQRKPLREVLEYRKAFLLVVAISGLNGALFYSQFIFSSSFLPMISPLSSFKVSQATTLGLFCYMLLLPLAGFLSDRWGHKRVMLGSALATLISAPFFLLIELTGGLFGVQLWVALLLATWYAPGMLILSRAFPAHVRCTGSGMGYTIGSTLFGGLTPNLCLAVYQASKSQLFPGIYLSLIAGLAGIIVLSTVKDSPRARVNTQQDVSPKGF